MTQLPVTLDHTGDVDAVPAGGQIMAFAFGDPEPVLDRRVLLDMLECPRTALWYEPPITMEGLARAFRVGAHHSSAILMKRNQLAASFRPTRYMSEETFSKVALDYLVLGNGYVRRIDNRLGEPLQLVHELGKYVRRGVVDGTFFWVPGSVPQQTYEPGTVFQLAQPDVNQEIYGVPYADFLRRYDRADMLFYLDPPYAGSEDDYGKGVFDPADFAAIAAQLGRGRARFILSINDTPAMREAFAGFRVHLVGTTYQIGAAARPARELVVSNFDLDGAFGSPIAG